jgi:hypothetical protein
LEGEIMEQHEGGCLCGGLRFVTTGEPDRVFVCHCKFCQRATGSAYLVEAVFPRTHFSIVQGRPTTYAVTSAGSGKQVTINFCATCGTKLFLEFERLPGDVGLYAGTYDDANWFALNPSNTRHIFLNSAQRGTVVPAAMHVFHEHIRDKDGAPIPPVIFDKPYQVE